MDLEKNVLDIVNEEGHFDLDEENNLSQGHESYQEGEERFSIDEINIKNPEENDLSSHQNNKKHNENKDTFKLSHAFSGVLSIPAIAITLVGSIAIIGTTSGFIPSLSDNHVSLFLSRSTELGFEVNKSSSKTLLLYLHNEEYGVDEQITLRDAFVFTDLMPSTVYDLEVYEINDNQSKRVYAANYLTKERDNYAALVRYSDVQDDQLTLDVRYEGNNIDYVTVKVLGDNNKTILTYEGSPKNEFTVNVNGYTNVTCKVSINGEMTHFEQIINPDDGYTPTPVGDWISDADNHWHEVDGIIQDLEAHDFVENIVVEPTFEETGTAKGICSVCGYESEEYEVPQKAHNYDTDWSTDETHHWHACTDVGYEDLKSDYEEHNFEEQDRRDATYSSDGYIYYVCSGCGETKNEVIPQLEHTFADDWTYNSWQHWHACLDDGYEDVKGSAEDHNYNTSGICSCGHQYFQYEMDDTLGGYKITGKDIDSNFDFSNIVFPSEYDEKPVVDVVTKIFPNGGVTSATIPNSFKHLSDATFYACSEMESITLPFVGSSVNNDTVSAESFFGWIFGTSGYAGSAYWVNMTTYGGARTLIPQSLATINITGGEILDHALRGLIYVKNINITGVSSIGEYAFADYIDGANKRLESISIDNSVTFIGDYAFANNPLETLTFLGTKAEWEDLDFGENWNTDSSLTAVQCSDELITL